MCFFLSHTFCLGRVFWVNGMLEYPSTTHFQCPGWLQCPGSDSTWPRPSSVWCGAVVLSPYQKNNPKAQCFHLHVWRWGWCSWGHGLHSSSSKPRQVELMSKSWILVSSDHNTFTQNHWQFKALMISVLHGVVLPIVFLLTMVPATLRSLTRSSHLVLDWFLTVLMIIETPRGEILHGAPVRGRYFSYFVFLPFANNRTNCCHLLTKLLGNGLVAHSSFVYVYNLVPDILGQLFGLGHGGVFGIWLIDCFCGQVSFIQVTKWD